MKIFRSYLQICSVASVIFLFFFLGCKSAVESSQNIEQDTDESGDPAWLIPSEDIIDGGPGRDGIPSIDNPKFISVNEVDHLEDEDRVLGVRVDGAVRAYPNIIMEYHEIVNDHVGGLPVALTFCPLTGTGIAWNRNIGGNVTEFGVSGLIYKNNLIPYDRNSESYWSQMLVKGIHGDHKNEDPAYIQVIETEWATWKKAFPNSKVLSRETGFGDTYDRHLYGNDYDTNDELILFPIENEDIRLNRKQRIHGVVVGNVKMAYSFKKFAGQVGVSNESVGGERVVIVGSSSLNVAASFFSKMEDGTLLTFTPVNGELPVIMEDNKGNRWDLFGKAVSGPREGEKLKSTHSYNAYWFAWVDFYPNTKVNDFVK